MNMVERVAFRLFVRRGLTHAINSAEESWERSRGTVIFQDCMDDARAVIADMKSPTEAMMSDRVIRQHGYAGDIDMVWDAMIDMALKEASE